MATLALRLAQIPINILNLRAMAPRADNLDQLGAEYQALGFGPYDPQGTTIDISPALLATSSILSPTHLPPGVEKVFKVTLATRSDHEELVGVALGGTAYLSPRAYNVLKARGVVVDA